MNNPKLFKAKARPSTIKEKCKLVLGTGQLANLLKNINKTLGKFNITGKWHGYHFQKLNKVPF